ncbi:unnamed protein product [Rotaria sordida]|uniref:Helix-turn-helix domain-containing protein n=1 Tax=Rotaria sordida TaxID=392033 RepID=A0A819YZ30_9BILA|nr:unnamed protein product [Rotaria sordida]CAF4165903.1 unnamed protein product [Rotaria sordida]
MIQNVVHNLTFEQIQFLNRGPTYVPPCQLHILSKSSFTLAQLVTKQMVPLRQQLTKLFTKYPVDLSRRMNFDTDIQITFNESFLGPLPPMLEHRAFYEKKLIQSIRYHLNKDRLILRRTADDKNTYYLGRLDELQQKSNEYIENSNSYEFIGIIDENNTEEKYLKEVIQSIGTGLEKLYQRKLINKDYLIKFSIQKKTNVKLPYVDFLPGKDQEDNLLVEPRFSSYRRSPIFALASYLEVILRPLYENHSQSTTFLNSGDFMQKLDYYCTQQQFLLKPTTNFATFKIHNLHMNVSHSSLLRVLNGFLVSSLVGTRLYKLSSEAIEELMALVLNNIFFTFKKKVYQFTKGCPLNLPITDLLCNIYLHDWQLSLLRQIRLKDSFYGRYHNRGFFTWNASTGYLERLFDELQQTLDSDIKLTTYIDNRVEFLNAIIKNNRGFLETRVYHNQQQQQQPFLLPYAKNHPRLLHRQWFRYSLIRAGQYCSSFEDFEEERRYIEMTFLTNGYSLDFVEYNLRQFYSRFYRSECKIKDINRHTYRILRRELFRLVDEEKRELKEEQQLQKSNKLIRLHYVFDWGSRCQFNEKFYKLWSDIITKDPIFKEFGLKIKLNTKYCYSSNMFLARIRKDM